MSKFDVGGTVEVEEVKREVEVKVVVEVGSDVEFEAVVEFGSEVEV